MENIEFNKQPIFTIITVVFNGDKFLEQTIRSVLNQTNKNFQFLIIDGGSTDNTLDIIKKYESEIDYWISEPDKGIYDAMNKGIALAKGEWIYFLNSDDYFFEEKTLEIAEQNIQILFPEYSIFYGNVLVVDNLGKMLGKYDCDYEKYDFQSKGQMLPHQGMFAHRNIFKIFGKFDILLKFAGDYDWLMRVLKEQRIKHIHNWVVANMTTGGLTNTRQNQFKMKKEYIKVMKKNNVPVATSFYYYTYRTYLVLFLESKLSTNFTELMKEKFRRVKRFLNIA